MKKPIFIFCLMFWTFAAGHIRNIYREKLRALFIRL